MTDESLECLWKQMVKEAQVASKNAKPASSKKVRFAIPEFKPVGIAPEPVDTFASD